MVSINVTLPNQLHAGAVVYAKDVARVGEFYAAVTALPVTEVESGYVVMEANGFQLLIFAIPSHIATDIEITTPPVRREETPIKLIFVVPSIAISRARVAAFGGLLNPTESEWQFHGVRVCDGYDPEGNVFQLRESVLNMAINPDAQVSQNQSG